jgi:NADPH:quinone reductase-like Zn-dependent oxidoreductase
MKAIVYDHYGSPDVLRLEELDTPKCADNQLLVRVRAASVNPLDWHFMEGTPYIARLVSFGLFKPKVNRLGVDYAGTVESVGSSVTRFKPGDAVFGGKTGALAGYVCVAPDRAVALKPANMTFERAAAVPIAAVTALQALRDNGKVQPGQKVLINGASGGVGTFAVQIAKSYGADVTGVCSTKNVELVRSIGADRVVDYTKDDFTKGGQRYDLILDNVGNRSLSEIRRVLNPNGTYVLIGGGGLQDSQWAGPLVRLIKASLWSQVGTRHMGMMLAELSAGDLTLLSGLMEAGKITPVIDRRYPLSETPEAIRYLEQGHARGKVVITMDDSGEPSPARAGGLATQTKTAGPGFVAFALLAVLLGVPVAPIVIALILNRLFRRRHPEKRPYRWGYYFSIQSLLAGIGLGFLLEAGVGALIVCGAMYGVLAWLFARRTRWAWIVLTIVSFNPLIWLFNFIYLRKRWAEESGRVPVIAGSTLR